MAGASIAAWLPRPVQSGIRLLEALRAVYEAFTAAGEEFDRRRGKPHCISGCGLCCLVNTPVVMEPEAAYVVAHLHQLTPPKQDALWRRLEDWLVRPAPVADTEQGRAQAIVGQACPFLGAAEEGFPCLVHAWRPLACRAYSVTASPDPFCRRPQSPYETDHQRAFLDNATAEDLREGVGEYVHRLRQGNGGRAPSGFLPFLVARFWHPERVCQLPVTRERTLQQPEPTAVLFEEQAMEAGRRVAFAPLPTLAAIAGETETQGYVARRITSSAAGASGGTRGDRRGPVGEKEQPPLGEPTAPIWTV